MENNKHIEELIRKKFSNFAPNPPDQIWHGIEKGIANTRDFNYFNTKNIIIVSSVLLISLLIGYFVVNPKLDKTENFDDLAPTIEIYDDDNFAEEIPTSSSPTIAKPETKNNVVNTNQNHQDLSSSHSIDNNDQNILVVLDNNNNIVEENDTEQLIIYPERKNITISHIQSLQGFNLSNNTIDYIPEKNEKIESLTPIEISLTEKIPVSNSGWRTSFLLSSEFPVTSIDSIEIMNSFSLNIEPSYYFNDHWFIRSGIGLSYVRDRGFARINYITNDYMGSYSDVYDITFDTISGNVIPVYHTKIVEVWDSVRHVSISSITNKYLFAQIPVLIGYQWKHQSVPLTFYAYAGPAFNIKISEWIEDPKPPAKDADIIDLENDLPVRSNYYMQLWVGAGLQYEINNNLSLTIEPGFRYYINSIYKDSDILPNSSGVSLRAGFVVSF